MIQETAQYRAADRVGRSLRRGNQPRLQIMSVLRISTTRRLRTWAAAFCGRWRADTGSRIDGVPRAEHTLRRLQKCGLDPFPSKAKITHRRRYGRLGAIHDRAYGQSANCTVG